MDFRFTVYFPMGAVTEGKAATKLTLEEMQRIVMGYIELVHTKDGEDMLVDEDGLGKQLAFNPNASDIAGQPIVGTALLLHYRMD